MSRFALDEDFPDTIIEALGLGVPEAELVPIRHINPGLRRMDDWELLLSLYHLQEWDGLITTDSRMLNLPRELTVLHQTNLTLVVVQEAGVERTVLRQIVGRCTRRSPAARAFVREIAAYLDAARTDPTLRFRQPPG